jgi:ribosomal protein S18 acetylase RimI-like enzyme
MSLKADAWLSAILGKPAFHLPPGPAFIPPQGPAFVDARIGAGDTAALLALQDKGFRVMDVSVQLVRPPGAMPAAGPDVREARPADAEAVKALAAEAFVFDRFHCDPAIGHDTASRLKAEWAGNYFTGKRGDGMVVAEDGVGICGFLQWLHVGGETVIDLIAVAGRSRGKGYGRAMIALAGSAGQALRVGTQIANLPSLALYGGSGFRQTAASYVLHLHIPEQS